MVEMLRRAVTNLPRFITINLAGTIVYVTNDKNQNTISMYAINAATGILTALATPTIATGNFPGWISIL